jgi:thiol-disulfide isomerase/thioredoxin
MKKIIFLLSTVLIGSLAVQAPAQQVEVVKMNKLESIMAAPEKGVKVVNFWATWCRPCVAELPHFEETYQNQKANGMELVLITLDDVEDLERRVQPFVSKKNLTAQVYLLDETDQNKFINAIDPDWGGAIPATIVIAANGERTLYEKPLTAQELENSVKPYLVN